jgi:hypothetical protein
VRRHALHRDTVGKIGDVGRAGCDALDVCGAVYSGVASATDADGDGIDDAMDLCPKVFDPIRPMDGGKQADADGDGVGDACDPCPLVANAMTCK